MLNHSNSFSDSQTRPQSLSETGDDPIRVPFSRISRKKRTLRFVRRFFVLLLNFVFNNVLFFSFLGFLNRRFDFLQTVFVCYPGRREYTEAYLFPSYVERLSWKPWIGGFFKQAGKWGLTMIITSSDDDFRNTENVSQLRGLVSYMENLRLLVSAKQNSYSGILPGVLLAQRLVKATPETDVTVGVVMKAIDHVKDKEFPLTNCSYVVLGAKGHVGRRVFSLLSERGESVHGVDLVDGKVDMSSWPASIHGEPAILINVTKKAALKNYVHLFWQDLVLLNETYPPPAKTELRELRERGSRAYHVVGVKAKAYPPFPRAYAGGVPCCAAWTSDSEALIRRL